MSGEPKGRLRDRTIRPSPGASLHILDDSVFVFSQEAQTLFKLNHTAAFIWFALEQGMPDDHVVASLSEAFGVSPPRAKRDFLAAVEEWTSLRLVGDGTPVGDSAESGTERKEADSATTQPFIFPHQTEFEERLSLRLSGHGIEVRFSTQEQATRVRPIFEPLLTRLDSADSVFLVYQDDPYQLVIQDGSILERCAGLDQLGPILSKEILAAACSSVDSLILLHAGVVAAAETCVALVGASTVGKTTLTGGLMAAGFKYFTDEVAIVDRATRRIVPCPVSLRVKDGAWDSFPALWERLGTVTGTMAPLGFRIRYVSPFPGSFAAEVSEALPVSSLVFPRYVPGKAAKLSPIRSADALVMLKEAGYALGGGLDREKVSELVDWIGGLDCYSLESGSLQDAVSLVSGLIH